MKILIDCGWLFLNHYGDVMSTKAKTTQQRKLDLRSAKKKKLFKKKGTTSKYESVISPDNSLKDEGTKTRNKKKIGELVWRSQTLKWSACVAVACAV